MKKGRLIIIALLQCVAGAFLLYRSVYGIIPMLPYAFYCLWTGRKAYLREQAWELNGQFSEALRSICASLEAGYSVENSINAAINDLSQLYAQDAQIIRELLYIRQQLKNSISAEQAFSDFAKRTGLEDIQSFADIFATAKRTGGDIIRVINQTSHVIQTKIEVKREIKTVISAKRYEAAIMKIMPAGILLYLNIFCAELCSTLYEGLFGRVFMTAALAVYIFACHMTDRIADIEM